MVIKDIERPTLRRTTKGSPARTRRATSSSVSLRQARSYVALEPAFDNLSRVLVSLEGLQKQRYACPDYSVIPKRGVCEGGYNERQKETHM